MRKLLIGSFVMALSGCATIPSPVVAPSPDQDQWILYKSVKWKIGRTKSVIEVPEGFVSDFASIPKWAQFLFSPHGRYSRAAVIHDFLYWTQSCSREQADNIFLIGMKESKVSPVQQQIIYWSVRGGGQAAWDQNRKLRQEGRPKVLDIQYRQIFTTTSWPQSREQAYNLGARDPQFSSDKSYCKIGNDIKVPNKPLTIKGFN